MIMYILFGIAGVLCLYEAVVRYNNRPTRAKDLLYEESRRDRLRILGHEGFDVTDLRG